MKFIAQNTFSPSFTPIFQQIWKFGRKSNNLLQDEESEEERPKTKTGRPMRKAVVKAVKRKIVQDEVIKFDTWKNSHWHAKCGKTLKPCIFLLYMPV